MATTLETDLVTQIDGYPAELRFGGGRHPVVTLSAVVTRLGDRTMEVRPDGGQPGLSGLLDQRFVWVEIELGGGRSVRPLAEVISATTSSLSLRYRHLFPAQRQTLEAARRGSSRGLVAIQ